MRALGPLKRHYVLTLPWLALFLILGWFFFQAIFIALGFFWSWTSLTPELREKVKSPRYKFSFFRFIFWIENCVEGQFFWEIKSFNKSIIIRSFGPVFFSLILSLMGGFDIFFLTLFGVLLAEGWIYFNRSFYPGAYKKSDSNLSENSL